MSFRPLRLAVITALGLAVPALAPASTLAQEAPGPSPSPGPGPGPGPGPAISDMRLEKVVLMVRHGLRAPLAEEAPVGDMAQAPWPTWPVDHSMLTARGYEGMRLLGVYDREAYAARGLFEASGCPLGGSVRVHASPSPRAIASAKAMIEGFAKGCAIPVSHAPAGGIDAIFDPGGAKVVTSDARAAIASIDQATGGIAALARRHAAAFHTLEDVLGCRAKGMTHPCDILSEASVLEASKNDPASFDFEGPIMTASGTAQVFLLEYAQGFPQAKVGWGRADPAAIEKMGELHSLLFDVLVRPPYQAARQSAVLGRRILASLRDPSGPRLDLVVGHDNNVNGMAAVLGVSFKVDGYARNDATVGGALGFELLRDSRSAQRYVRVIYQSQTLEQLRELTPLSLAHPPAYATLPVAACGRADGLCTLEDFTRLVESRLAPLDGPGMAAN